MTASGISASQLHVAIANGAAPIIIDVRKRDAFAGSSEMISGSVRRDPEQVSSWSKSLPTHKAVVVYCVHGHEVSQKAAATLAASGTEACFLEGGLEEGWKGIQGAIDAKALNGPTKWVTRE